MPTCSSSAPVPAASPGASCSATTRAPRSTARRAPSPSRRSATPSRPGAIETIGVGYDGSPESEAALALARASRGGDRRRACTRSQVVQMPTSLFVGFAADAWNDELTDIVRPPNQLAARRRTGGGGGRAVRRGARDAFGDARRPARRRFARATGRFAGSCSEARRCIWPLTRAAPCSCCRAGRRRARGERRGARRTAAAAMPTVELPRGPAGGVRMAARWRDGNPARTRIARYEERSMATVEQSINLRRARSRRQSGHPAGPLRQLHRRRVGGADATASTGRT